MRPGTLLVFTSVTILLENVSHVCHARRNDANGTKIIAREFAKQSNILFKMLVKISEIYICTFV